MVDVGSMASKFSDLLGNHMGQFDGVSLLKERSIEELSDMIPGDGVVLLIDRSGALPVVDPGCCDAMVTTFPEAPLPWVSVDHRRLEAMLDKIRRTVAGAPNATSILARLLRMNDGISFETALELESLAYSTLLGGEEFRRWVNVAERKSSGAQAVPPVRYEREGDEVTLTLCSPGNRNAMTAAMRDALFEALANVIEDPSQPSVTLRAEGRCFSTGGDLAEFGSARDLAMAHLIRTGRSCARLLHQLGDRARVQLHGACIGSGIEVPVSASERIGSRNTIIQLPELTMGLIPGAGGTVSLARAIGRHRFLWLCLGAFRIDARRALDWGLLNKIEP